MVLFVFSKCFNCEIVRFLTSKNGKLLVNYLQSTIYNDAIPKGIKGVKISHKVGMIPMYQVSHDYGIIYDQDPFVLAVMTKGFTYEKSNKVIAGIALIVSKHHKNKLKYIKTKSDIPVYKNQNKKTIIGTLNKKEVYRVITPSNGKWVGIQVGKINGYVQNMDVNTYAKAPTNLTYKNIEMKRKVTTKIETMVLKTASLKATSLATINEGVQISVSKINKDYYGILLGNRMGYIKATDVKPAK
ncbi:MAG TPA: serine hydrolase [Rummeliibacillus sp.]|nr:serine hydrolase [Rummeliibacillus sp.]